MAGRTVRLNQLGGFMKKLSFYFAASAIAVAAVSVAVAGGRHPLPSVSGNHVSPHLFLGPPGSVSLYSQLANDSGVATVSQNFESGYDTYDSQGGDSFYVPTGHVWTVTQVNVVGVYFNGAGPAVSENVFFYKNNAGVPGDLIAEFANVHGVDSGTGSFQIHLPGSLIFKHGSYWVSVQANLDFGTAGEWGWETASVQRRLPAAWQNPPDGFGSGCTTWGALSTCLPGTGVDYLFALRGTDKTL
jgi:hypothetical protein